MKKTIFILSVLLITFSACKKPFNCDTTVYTGEKVRIPITFIGFFPHQVNIIQVYRTNPANPGKIDTFSLDRLLWSYSAKGSNIPSGIKEAITDRALDKQMDGDGNAMDDNLYSYLNNSTLILDWETNRDTLANIIIKKSRGTTDAKCVEGDPLVLVDHVSYTFRGKVIPQDTVIVLNK